MRDGELGEATKISKLIAPIFGAITLIVSTKYPVQAQSVSNTQREWRQVDPQVKQCINLMLSSKNVSVEQLGAAGIAPNDQHISPAINACNQYLATPLKTNVPCTVTNSKGLQVATTCNESYAKEVDGSLVPISGDEMLVAAGNGEKIAASLFETTVAQTARLAEEKGHLGERLNESASKADETVTVDSMLEFLKNDAQRRYRLYNKMMEPLPGSDIPSLQLARQKSKMFTATLSCKHEGFVATYFGIGFDNVEKTPGMGTSSLWHAVFEIFGDYPMGLSPSGQASFGGPPDDIAVWFNPNNISLHLTEDGLTSDLNGVRVICRVVKGGDLFQWFPLGY